MELHERDFEDLKTQCVNLLAELNDVNDLPSLLVLDRNVVQKVKVVTKRLIEGCADKGVVSPLLILQYVCLLDQILLARPRIREDQAELTLLWSSYFVMLLNRCREKSLWRRRIILQHSAKLQVLEGLDLPFAWRRLLSMPEIPSDTIDEREVMMLFQTYAYVVDLCEPALDMSRKVSVCEDRCLAYDVLIHFGSISAMPNAQSKISKMIKRKIDLTRSLLNLSELHTRCGDYRRLQFQLGCCCLEMLENKMKIFEKNSSNLKPILLQKMAYYVETGVKEFKLYVTTVSKGNVDDWGSLSQIEKICVVKAWFQIARLYNKFFSPDRKEQMAYTKLAICYYTRVMDSESKIGSGQCAEEIRVSIETSDLLRRQVKMQEKEQEL